jgi:hypothetical protein
MTNLMHNSFLCIYFNSLHVSNNPVLIIRSINCIDTTSGTSHSVSVTVSCAGRKDAQSTNYKTLLCKTKQIYKYKNIETKFYKNNAAIWYNKTCRMKQITPSLLRIKGVPFRPTSETVTDTE